MELLINILLPRMFNSDHVSFETIWVFGDSRKKKTWMIHDNTYVSVDLRRNVIVQQHFHSMTVEISCLIKGLRYAFALLLVNMSY